MEQKTAVEWLIEKHFGGINNCTPDFRFHINQALEMEKQQIIDAQLNGQREEVKFIKEARIEAEQYYEQTYKSK